MIWIIILTVLLLLIIALIAILVASSITGNIAFLVNGIKRFRGGERQFRLQSKAADEFGTLANSFDDMADSIEGSVKNPLAITDLNRKVIYMNDYGLKICNTTLDKVIGSSYGDYSVYPSETIYDPIEALQKGREAEVYHLESEDRYIKGHANYLKDKDDKNIGYIIETTDITEIISGQIKTHEQKILLDTVFSASPDLVWYLNTAGEYLSVNPRYAAVTGRSVNELIGLNANDVLKDSPARELLVDDLIALNSDQPVYKEESIVFADSHQEVLESVRVPIFGASGERVGLLGYARDVTARVRIDAELRKTQNELEKAVEEANLASSHKGDFLARMSHEIRTPMNAIIGITNIVLRKLGDLPQNDANVGDITAKVNQIEKSSQHLLGLLNDVLDLSKIEAGKIDISDEIFEMGTLLDTVMGIIRPRCSDKNIEFKTDFDDLSYSAYHGDPLRLRQVLINLLGNAVKFTSECGAIELVVKKAERKEGKTLVAFG